MSQNEINLETDINYIREQLKTDQNSSDNMYAKALYALDRINDVIITNNNTYDKKSKIII